jgi:hypothetical protein
MISSSSSVFSTIVSLSLVFITAFFGLKGLIYAFEAILATTERSFNFLNINTYSSGNPQV